MPGFDSLILAEFQHMLHDLNPYSKIFKQNGDIITSNLFINLKMLIIDNRKKDSRCYNTLSTAEVAAIIIENGQETDKCYYLRLLLIVICGTTSFQHLCSINGVVFPTFQNACDALGLLHNNDEWDLCLSEAAQIRTGSQLCYLFTTILLFCTLFHPEQLWTKYFNFLTEDIQFYNNITMFTDTNIKNHALSHLQSILQKYSKFFANFPNMFILPTVERTNTLIAKELNYNPNELSYIIKNGGQTAHSWFKLSINLHKDSTCSFSHGSDTASNTISLPEQIVLKSHTLNDLITSVYSNFSFHYDSHFLAEHVILTLRNDDVHAINANILSQFPEVVSEYHSADTIENQPEA
ncbi:23974_t:CDS:2 [Cetraspora pellucida]|uniref:23974_t:CDS:1 n=1 Tax=Cetraspora pellucida TaxID=1433469 RepID=A0A9N8W711_9GLOM|nr:23974_t:CDS:2 [Cetraspora pellucida]